MDLSHVHAFREEVAARGFANLLLVVDGHLAMREILGEPGRING
jgi:hypothetical protein